MTCDLHSAGGSTRGDNHFSQGTGFSGFESLKGPFSCVPRPGSWDHSVVEEDLDLEDSVPVSWNVLECSGFIVPSPFRLDSFRLWKRVRKTP